MIRVQNPVPMVRENAAKIAQKVLETDMTNIVVSQWEVETHTENDKTTYVVFCAINRRLDPLDKPRLLHMLASDYEHLKLMFHDVEFIA